MKPMTVTELLTKYQEINTIFGQKFPIDDHEKRVFAKFTKVIEEMGEFADLCLAKANLQRSEKNPTNVDELMAEEFSDAIGALMLLGIESGIDIETALGNKIEFTLARLKKQ